MRMRSEAVEDNRRVGNEVPVNSTTDKRSRSAERADMPPELADAADRNKKLSSALQEAREEICALKEEVEKLCAPPSTYGVYLAENEDGTVNVLSQGRKV